MLPLPRLALLLLLVAPLWLLGAVAGLVGVLAVLAAVLADVALAVRADGVEVERVLPPTAALREPVHGEYIVRSRAARRLRVALYDQLPPSLERRDADGEPLPARDPVKPPLPTARFEIPASGEVRLPLDFLPLVRGEHAPGPLALRIPGPLGVIARVLRVAPDDRILIVPSLAGVRRYRLLALHHRLRDAGVRAVRRRGDGTSFSSLREYVPGDDPRRIDWKATARRATLVTREHDVEQGQTIIIAVDAGRLMTQMADDRPRFEHALSSALVLADVAAQSGDRVGLLLFDDAVRAWVPPVKGNVALERIRAALIPARATMSEPDYAAAFRTLSTRHRKRSLVVLFTDVVDPRSAQALVAHLTRGGARHLPLIVALRDDALLAVAAGERRAEPTAVERPRDSRVSGDASWGSPDAGYERAAAEDVLAAREEALTRMRRAGASVVDVSPRAMAAAVVNRYLELKRRGAL